MNREAVQPLERILVIEDELAMRIALRDCLAAEGYRLLTAENGELGLEKVLAEKPDLVILDVMMPRLDGYALAREARRLNLAMPILMLTARGQVQDRVTGLDAGADDYLVKPFSTDELLARVRSLLRRVKRQTKGVRDLKIGELEIQFAHQKVFRAGQEVHLTNKEFSMLRLMVEVAPEPVSRDRFLDVVWGYSAFPSTRTIDNHVVSLRQKLERDPDHPSLIKTVHGAGYRFEMPEFT